MAKPPVIQLKILAFSSPEKWEAWLDRNHLHSNGIWLRFYKKASGKPSVTYAEALDLALCHGWIDSQVKSYDALSYLQRFSPRRARSVWSKVNTGHVERLIQAGRMKPAGQRQIDAAKQDGRWAAAYASPREAILPEEFLKAVAKNRKAKAFLASLNRHNLYAIVHRLQTAQRPETRARRIRTFVTMLAKGEKFHP
jgi:uncharacterized protein YdeI (YjbR/CyaY-like superfamily)